MVPGLFPGGVPGPAAVGNFPLWLVIAQVPLQRRFRARRERTTQHIAATVTVLVYIQHALSLPLETVGHLISSVSFSS